MKLFFLRFANLAAMLLLFLSLPVQGKETLYEIYRQAGEVTSIVQYGDEIWISSYGKGIHYYNLKTKVWNSFSTEQKNIDNDFFYCVAVSELYIWGGTSDGLMIYDRKRKAWRKRKFASGGEYGNWIRSLHYDKEQGILWIGRFVNLTRFDEKKNKFDDFDLTQNKLAGSNNIKVIKPEGEKYLWIGTESGVFLYNKALEPSDRSALTFYSNKGNGFRGEGESVSIADILPEDKYVWFATEEFITPDQPDFNLGGIYRFNRRATWDKFDKRTGLKANGISAIARMGRNMFAAQYVFDSNSKQGVGRGVTMFDRITGKPLQFDPEEIKLETNDVSHLYFDGEHLWIGTKIGLWKVKMNNAFANPEFRSGRQISNNKKNN
ncbi:MAG: hypothetical protein HRU80_06290 [Ignavibacteriales bacterium]|nr:MAG: hypothetical protein HRU80_06290 [Ignavibacteriales bacterium]